MKKKLETRVEIDAPVATVWAVLEDFDAYAEWNEDVVFHGEPRVGESVPMTVKLRGRTLTVPVRFEAIDAEYELRWRGGPAFLMHGTHHLRVRALDAARTELVHGEVFGGVALPLLWPMLRGELLAFYERINAAVKARAEARASV